MVGNYRKKNLSLTENVSFERNEQTKAISKLKAHQNEIQILKMEISKLKRQDNEVQKLRMKNLNLEKINLDLQFDIAFDKILIKQLNDDLNQIKKTK